jgi:hypothetical protein
MIKKRRTLCAKHWTSKLPEGVTISAAAGLAMILASLYQSMARAGRAIGDGRRVAAKH